MQLQKGRVAITDYLYAKAGNILQAYYESIDLNELYKIWDISLYGKKYYGNNQETNIWKAADINAKEIIFKLKEIMLMVK